MSILNRNELRRLEKAAREKDKKHLMDWAVQLEAQIASQLKRTMEQNYQTEIQNSIENLLTATAYALLFSEETVLNKDSLGDFMADLFTTIDMFRTGEYTPDEYRDIISKEGVELDKYDSDQIYKKYLNILDTELVKFLKTKPRKIITICGNSYNKRKTKRLNITR